MCGSTVHEHVYTCIIRFIIFPQRKLYIMLSLVASIPYMYIRVHACIYTLYMYMYIYYMVTKFLQPPPYIYIHVHVQYIHVHMYHDFRSIICLVYYLYYTCSYNMRKQYMLTSFTNLHVHMYVLQETENKTTLSEAFICLKLARLVRDAPPNIVEFFGASIVPYYNGNNLQLFLELMPGENTVLCI